MSTPATTSSIPNFGWETSASGRSGRSTVRPNGARSDWPAQCPSGECLRCRYYFACNGEVSEAPVRNGGRTVAAKNSLCAGLMRWFAHAEPYMERMRGLLAQHWSPAWVMPFARRRMGLE